MKVIFPLTFFLFLCLLRGAAAGDADAVPFELPITVREHLGHDWEPQLIHQRISVPAQGALYAHRAALFQDDQPVAMQFDNIDVYPDGSIKSADIWFRTDLPAKSSRTFTLRAVVAAPPAVETDLAVDALGTTMVLRNSHIAVKLPAGSWHANAEATREQTADSLRQHLEMQHDPPVPGRGTTGNDSDLMLPGAVLGIRMPSGRWTAPFYLMPHREFKYHVDLLQPVDPDEPAGVLKGYTAKIVASGPIFTRAVVRHAFEGGESTTTVTVRSGEPFVRIDEEYQNAGALIIDLTRGIDPTAVVHKSNRVSELGKTISLPPADVARQVALFVGWDYYFTGVAPAWALVGDEKGDVLGLVSTDSDWLPYPYNQGIHVFSDADGNLTGAASLAAGQRHWAISAHTAAELASPNETQAFYRWWHRNLVLPLDKVANWTLVWPGMESLQFPHTFFAAEDLPKIRQDLQASPVINDFMKGLPQKEFTSAAAHWLYNDSAEMERLTDPDKRYIDKLPALFLENSGYWDNNRLNYMQITDELLTRYVGLELLLGSDAIVPAQKQILLSQLAFLQHLICDPMFWPPNYPYNPQVPAPYPAYVQGTPNQKICYITAQGILACMLKNHPTFSTWIEGTLLEFERVASGSVAPSGAHLESPFYSSRDTMRFGPFLSALRRANAGGDAMHRWFERLQNCFTYLGDMLTPPESRMGGVRVYHPIGRSSSGVVDPTMLIAAEPFGRDDPQFTRNMRRRWEEQGRPPPDITGNTGGRDMSLTMLAAARMLQHDAAESTPFKSRRWEGMGAVLRSQPGTDFESNIVFRHDTFAWNLYEANNGAVYFYGKGAPLLPRFGAYWMAQKGQPNLMSIPFGNRLLFAEGDATEQWVNGLGEMRVFSALGNLADYAVGATRDGHWTRSVLFAKDLDRQDPVYLLVRDDVSRPDAASALHWWIMSRQVQPDGLEQPGVVPTKGSDEQWLANLGKNWKDAPDMSGQLHHFTGQSGVDLDMFIALPTDPSITTDAVGTGPGMPYCVNPNLYEYQQLVRIEQSTGKNYLTLFVPRWPDSEQPHYRTIAEGAGVAISAPGSEDRLFQAWSPIAYSDAVVSFEGLAGFARTGQNGILRLMIVEGRISASGISLTSAKAAAAVLDGDTLTVYTSQNASNVDVQLSAAQQGVTIKFRREQP